MIGLTSVWDGEACECVPGGSPPLSRRRLTKGRPFFAFFRDFDSKSHPVAGGIRARFVSSRGSVDLWRTEMASRLRRGTVWVARGFLPAPAEAV